MADDGRRRGLLGRLGLGAGRDIEVVLWVVLGLAVGALVGAYAVVSSLVEAFSR